MTDYNNAESLRNYALTHSPCKGAVNICTARRNWNGCDYADVYAGAGLECWKQDAPHKCVRCLRIPRSEQKGA